MDVSKPSDLAVLTGGYFGRGMAKPSATCDGHQRKKEEPLRGGGGGTCQGERRVHWFMCISECVCMCVFPVNHTSARAWCQGSCVTVIHRDWRWHLRSQTFAKDRRWSFYAPATTCRHFFSVFLRATGCCWVFFSNCRRQPCIVF